MSFIARIRHPLAAFALCVLSPMAAIADEADQPNRLDVGMSYSQLSGGYSDWQSAYARVALPAARGATYLEAIRRREFDEVGTLLSAGRVQDLNADWGVSGFVSVGSGGDFLPHSKWDVGVARKLLADRSLVLSAGLGRSINHHDYRDDTMRLSATYYLSSAWVLEQGLRWTVSHPGSVSGQRWYGVVGWRQPGQREITARIETGSEGWTAQGNQDFVVGFDSQLASLAWSEWLTPRQGVKVMVEHYDNPYYNRTTLDLSVFTQF